MSSASEKRRSVWSWLLPTVTTVIVVGRIASYRVAQDEGTAPDLLPAGMIDLVLILAPSFLLGLWSGVRAAIRKAREAPWTEPAPEVLWYFAWDKVPRGPIDTAQLRTLLKSGKLQPTSWVLKSGSTEWLEAGRFHELN